MHRVDVARLRPRIAVCALLALASASVGRTLSPAAPPTSGHPSLAGVMPVGPGDVPPPDKKDGPEPKQPAYCPPPTCCGTKPAYSDPYYQTHFTGQVLVMTAEVMQPQGGHSDFAVTIFDIKDHASAPLDSNWDPPNFRYHDPRWTRTNLGSVFGVTLDDVGNIYTAHTTIYNGSDPIGALSGSTAGTIYKLATVTGDPSVFVSLPNNGPGLGNVAWDCQNEQMFASNFEDGRIYRIDSDGTLLSAFDHATGAITNAVGGVLPNEPGEPDGQWAELGERPWAVKRAGNRLYYSVWSRDGRNLFGAPPPPPNQIWSIQLDASGNFVAGTVTLELTMPPYGTYEHSYPVSDISFSPDASARMLVAERVMSSDSYSSAHEGRVMEFQCSFGVWTLTPANTNPNGVTYGFPIGQYQNHTNSAGGCDYDPLPNGRVWCSADALHVGTPDYIYGGCGMLRAGATPANDILFDYNGDVTTSADKHQIGDIVIPCNPAPCMFISDVSSHCEGSFYSTNFTVTNLSGVTAHYVLLPHPNMSPHVVPLSPPLPSGGSASVTVTISGADLPTPFCFDVILADVYVEACCSDNVCIDLPPCECVLPTINITCDPRNGMSLLTIHLVNLGSVVLEDAFLIPLAPHSGALLTPSYFNLPSVPPAGSTTISTHISGVPSGEYFCARLAVHDAAHTACCSVVVCAIIPPPCSGSPCQADFNNDGVVDSADFFAFLAAFFDGDHGADYDQSGTVNAADFFAFLTDFFNNCG